MTILCYGECELLEMKWGGMAGTVGTRGNVVRDGTAEWRRGPDPLGPFTLRIFVSRAVGRLWEILSSVGMEGKGMAGSGLFSQRTGIEGTGGEKYG